ncbi:hypothetical protein J4E93_008917 [Alternaria ventricosa]|uniref:uncharacterized protein n=1 Tax=Alternaria ventricosa TaxID=1187951 RepID=UPI0020C46061|nr:uncharacterized protein J4E93_008917 [Alternaria ventricosa]KAI4640117.1 hypothetical protein J4E93_008917 [Alternaria ventricosa]
MQKNCRFCKWERELDGIPVEEVAPPSNLEKIRTDMRARAAARKSHGTERERDGTASTSWPPDDARFDMNPLASPLVSRSRRDSVTSCRSEAMAEPYDYFTEQPGTTDVETDDNEDSGDIEMAEGEGNNGIEPPSPASSSVYSNDNPLVLPHSPLYTQSESGIPDDSNDNDKNDSLDFLDEVLFDLDAWLDAGGLEMGGLHDDMPEEEYAEYKEWYKAIVGGVARGMVERGMLMERTRRRSV